jgi:hypothetical protein
MFTRLIIPWEIALNDKKNVPNEDRMSIIGTKKIRSSFDCGPSSPVESFNCTIIVMIIAPLPRPKANKTVD